MHRHQNKPTRQQLTIQSIAASARAYTDERETASSSTHSRGHKKWNQKDFDMAIAEYRRTNLCPPGTGHKLCTGA